MTNSQFPGEDPSRERQPLAGGVFILLGLLAGIVFGIYSHAISLGVIVGLLVGVIFAVALWLFDRRRS